jgi:class 3 adenylate cyclase/CheY-like chemotaxis protein
MVKLTKILLLEDVEDDAVLVEKIMKKGGVKFITRRVDTREEFKEALQSFKPDLVISDHSLPQFNSIEALKICKETGTDVPFILVTGTVSEEFAVNCIKQGVYDYILKSNLARLPSSVHSALAHYDAILEKRKREEEIIRLNAGLENSIKKRTSELADAKSFLDSIINSLPGIFYLLDGNLKIIKWNSNFENYVCGGRNPSSMNPLEMVHTDHRDILMQQIERTFLIGDATSEVNLVTKDNGVVPYILRSFRTVIDENQFIFISGFDISEQKQAQEILRLNKDRLEGMLMQMQESTALLQHSNEQVTHQKSQLEKEKQKADKLLMTILPEPIAMELKEKGHAQAQQFGMATVLFADLVNFTLLSKDLNADQMVSELNWIFVGFDFIADRNNMERIKTIGDGYMAVGGVPIRNNTNPIDVVNAGLQIAEFIKRLSRENEKSGKPAWKVRVGIHTGEVVAGVIGKSKFSYDIWGPTVNTASRMESACEPGRVNISDTTYQLVRDHFACTHRGNVIVKNMGKMEMYYAEAKPTTNSPN